MRRLVLGRKVRAVMWLAALGLTATGSVAFAGEGITVTGTGTVEALPDVVELVATVEGNAELAGDAVEKYRGNKRRAEEALNSLGIDGVTVAGSGLALNSGSQAANPIVAMQAGQNQPKVPDKVAVQEQLSITLSGVAAMQPDDVLRAVTRIVDATKDAGLAIGPAPRSMIEIQFSGAKPSSFLTFKLADIEKLRGDAYQAAIKEARAKAEHVAKLAGVSLGEIVSIEESAPVAKGKDDGGMSAYMALLGAAARTQAEGTSTELEKIPVTVSLKVQFAIK